MCVSFLSHNSLSLLGMVLDYSISYFLKLSIVFCIFFFLSAIKNDSKKEQATNCCPDIACSTRCFLCVYNFSGIKLVILAALRDQLIMRTFFYNMSLLKYHDAVTVSHGGKAMRDHKGRASFH